MTTDPLWCYENYGVAAECIDQQEKKIIELQAHRNTLLEAGQALIDRWDSPNWKDAEHTGIFIDALRKALSATPAESLAKRDDEVLERAEKAADSARWAGTDVVLAIRALKEVTK